MQYLRLDDTQRAQLLDALAAMPDYLRREFVGLNAEEARLPGADGGFCPLEQVWHLADLEQEGFAVRIRRLCEEDEPVLEDFDGARIAQERNYRARMLAPGLEAFGRARRANLAALRSLAAPVWRRAGIQAGIGAVMLCDMPSFLLQHDAAHRLEIEGWKQHAALRRSRTS